MCYNTCWLCMQAGRVPVMWVGGTYHRERRGGYCPMGSNHMLPHLLRCSSDLSCKPINTHHVKNKQTGYNFSVQWSLLMQIEQNCIGFARV